MPASYLPTTQPQPTYSGISAFNNTAPPAPMGGLTQPNTQTIFNPASWRGESEAAIDAARHYGALGIASLLPNLYGQLDNVGAGIDQQNLARTNLNQFGSASGRANRVSAYQNQAMADAATQAKKLRAQIMAQTGQDIGAGALLLMHNAAGRATGQYRSSLESPEVQEQIAAMLMKVNSPQEVMSLLPVLMAMDEQDRPRAMQFLQQEHENQANGGLGGMLGGIGQLVGIASGVKGLTTAAAVAGAGKKG